MDSGVISTLITRASSIWLELVKDYDLEIHYHPGKAKVVADALSRRSYVNMAVAFQIPPELCEIGRASCRERV